jgi:hypothetical protein
MLGTVGAITLCCATIFAIGICSNSTPDSTASSTTEGEARVTEKVQEEVATQDQETAIVVVEQTEVAQPTETSTLEPTPDIQKVETSEGYIFLVPGIAYVDGRDQEADPPLTVMNINIWDSISRSKAVCKISHGSEVQLLDSKYKDAENRYYFYLQREDCKGWLTEEFLSEQKEEPIGDEF